MRPPATGHRAGSLKIKQHLLRTILVPNVVHKLQLPLFLTQTPFWQPVIRSACNGGLGREQPKVQISARKKWRSKCVIKAFSAENQCDVNLLSSDVGVGRPLGLM